MSLSRLSLRTLACTPLLLAGCSMNYGPGMACAGDCVSGTGTLTYQRDGRTETGTFHLGQGVGLQTISDGNGQTITVLMRNGVPHGPARIRTASGQEFEQTWAYGLPASGKTVYANGDVYEGSYQTLLTSAGPLTLPREGSYLTATGDRYQGRFERLADQVVFRGTQASAGRKPASVLAASAVAPGRAPLSLAPLGKAELESLQARHMAWTPAAVADRSSDVQASRYFSDLKEYHAHQQQRMAVGAATPTAASALAAPAAAAAPAQSLAVAGQGRAAPAGYQLIEGNRGKYMSPFTSDGVAAGWVDKAVSAQLGGALGAAAGAYAGQKALEQVPFVGGFLGNKVGKSAGRTIALNAVGGEAFLRESSDLSFNDVNEMARWLVATHAQHAKFKEIMKASYQIYPELEQAVLQAQYARR